jgi:hypothetical protein
MNSAGRRKRFSDLVRRLRTDLELNSVPALVLAAILIGVLAGLFAPEVHSRADANALVAVFVGLLAGVVAILAVYAVVANWKGARNRRFALLVAGLGCGAAVAGLFSMPLDAYRYAFAVSVAAFLDQVLTVIVLFF